MSSALALQHKTWKAANDRLWRQKPARVTARDKMAELITRQREEARQPPPVVIRSIADITRPKWALIALEVCAKHQVTMIDLMSPRRDRPTVAARQEVMYRLRTETTMSLPQIGKRLGNRDHTTVYHGIWKHKQRMADAADISSVNCAA